MLLQINIHYFEPLGLIYVIVILSHNDMTFCKISWQKSMNVQVPHASTMVAVLMKSTVSTVLVGVAMQDLLVLQVSVERKQINVNSYTPT